MSSDISRSMFDLSLESSDCICAIATPHGLGGISVIRVSGPKSFEITRRICGFLPSTPESHKIYYGFAKQAKGNQNLDEVLVAYFSHGKSFTGEESTEISCHGSPVISESIVQALIGSGARLARPGEFTCRAFFNGRIDLVQAESVLALIESQSKQASRQALRQLEGELSVEYGKIEDSFLWVLAQIEAGIDFSTEGLETVSFGKILSRLDLERLRVRALLDSYESGRITRDGLVVVLLGKPNVGKSSLLNALLKEERAIVTDEPGTTRDLVRASLSLGGVRIELFDTAGIREANSKSEKLGIQKSFEMMEKADVVLHVIESGSPVLVELSNSASRQSQQIAFIFNKSDLNTKASNLTPEGEQSFSVSAKTGDGLAELRTWLMNIAAEKSSETQLAVSQARHFELLSKIDVSLNSAIKLIKEEQSAEFVAQELQIGIRSIHELVGKAFDEQVIDRVFKEFCLGK